MPRQKKARRFDPRPGVSVIALETEAEYLRCEIEDYSIFAPTEIETKRLERHANCRHTWQQVCLLIETMPDRDQRVLQALLFRDLWYVLELYKTYLNPTDQTVPASVSTARAAAKASLPFNTFLFDL